MTLPELLKEAERLAQGGFMDALWLRRQRLRIEAGEEKLALTQTYVSAYEDERDGVRLDGSAMLFERKRKAHQLLLMSRSEARLYAEAVAQLVEELEMECIRAEQKRAMATQKEVRA